MFIVLKTTAYKADRAIAECLHSYSHDKPEAEIIFVAAGTGPEIHEVGLLFYMTCDFPDFYIA